MRAISSRLLLGSIWITASRGLVNALGFISTVVLAHLLTPADFGLVALGTTMLAILQAITQLSLSQALIHHPAPTEAHFHTAWTLGTMRGLMLGALFAAAAPAAAAFYGDVRLESIMYALAFSIFLSGLSNPRRIMLTRELIFWQDFVLNVSQKLIGVIVGVLIAYIYQSYWSLVLSIIAGQLAQVIISYTALPFRPRFALRHARDLWSFSIWLTLGEIVTTINLRFDHLLIGKFLGRDDLGQYTVGSNLAMLPTREATLPLTQSLFPAFAMLKEDFERLRRAYQRSQTLVTTIALPLGVGTALIADPLVLLTMGEKWLPAAFVIQALGTIFAVQTIGALVDPLGMALGHTRLIFMRNTQFMFVRLPLIVAGMYLGGFNGMIIARIFAGLISVAVNLALVKRLIAMPIGTQLIVNLRAMVGVLMMSAAVLKAQEYLTPSDDPKQLTLQIAILVAVGAATYVSGTLALWLISGRPAGPEREIIKLLRTVAGKISGAKK